VVEDYTLTTKLTGEPPDAPWVTDWDGSNDWEFTSAGTDAPRAAVLAWDGAVARSRARLAAALAAGGLDQLVHVADDEGRHASLRRLVCDLIEEYGRHTGHADLIREAVDGLVGEDPSGTVAPVSETRSRSRSSKVTSRPPARRAGRTCGQAPAGAAGRPCAGASGTGCGGLDPSPPSPPESGPTGCGS
jgi:hypothetical protein